MYLNNGKRLLKPLTFNKSNLTETYDVFKLKIGYYSYSFMNINLTETYDVFKFVKCYYFEFFC